MNLERFVAIGISAVHPLHCSREFRGLRGKVIVIATPVIYRDVVHIADLTGVTLTCSCRNVTDNHVSQSIVLQCVVIENEASKMHLSAKPLILKVPRIQRMFKSNNMYLCFEPCRICQQKQCCVNILGCKQRIEILLI